MTHAPSNRSFALEICVDSLDSALAAEQGGAQRVELCSALSEGGLTPSLGLIRAVRKRLNIGLQVLIRPRVGGFVYSEEEFDVMREDLLLAAESGADGIVVGLLTTAGDIDVERTQELVQLAQPLETTFHRAFDGSRDLGIALEDVITAGATRLLTSGGEATASAGATRLRDLVTAARGRIEVMAGGGVRAGNIASLIDTLGDVSTSRLAFHSALRHAPPPIAHAVEASFADASRCLVRAEDVHALRQAIDRAAGPRATGPQAT